MNTLRFTLVADGPTDAVLLHPLRWLLVENGVLHPLEAVWADLRGLPEPPSALEAKISAALDLYPCDLLFVHRDAERESRGKRVEEIRQAVKRVATDLFAERPYVCVVPVRMTEAWLLFDEGAIRRAAANPHGSIALSLPAVSRVEDLPNPKTILHDLLSKATEKPPRRLRKFAVGQAVHRLAELVQDFSPLRKAPAFAALEADLQQIIREARWTR